jgi:hypothetical protein
MSRRNLAAFFRSQSVSYIDVEDASRQILPDGKFPDDGPEPFHFVIYGAEFNWLIFAGPRTKETIAIMERWEKLFGVPFVAVFARFRTHPTFESIDGESLSWERFLDRRPHDKPSRLDFYQAKDTAPLCVGAQLDLFA